MLMTVVNVICNQLCYPADFEVLLYTIIYVVESYLQSLKVSHIAGDCYHVGRAWAPRNFLGAEDMSGKEI